MKILIITVLVVICIQYCKKNEGRDNPVNIVSEWMGKEIMFPDNVPCFVLGKDTLPELCHDCFHKEFKILLYVDSTGCSSCRLKLLEWKQLIEEADSLFQGKVGFLLYFQPKRIKTMGYLFEDEKFEYPVFIDLNDEINHLNRFPQAMQYQCFLLDIDNKVLAIGNPVMNLKIWELYKSYIANGKKIETNMITSITLDKAAHDFGTLRKGDTGSADFTIANTGNELLVIFRVSVECGCTRAIWNKEPIAPGQSTTITIKITPDEPGQFNKTIVVYCNANESPVKLRVAGMTRE